jgi:hypothetical protein
MNILLGRFNVPRVATEDMLERSRDVQEGVTLSGVGVDVRDARPWFTK